MVVGSNKGGGAVALLFLAGVLVVEVVVFGEDGAGVLEICIGNALAFFLGAFIRGVGVSAGDLIRRPIPRFETFGGG